MTYEEWISIGEREGYVSQPTCYFHDMLPMTASEEEEIDEGGDPCITVLRLYPDPLTRQLVKETRA